MTVETTQVYFPKEESHDRPRYRYTKVQLGEPMSYTEFTNRNTGEGFLTGAEMTQGQLHYQSLLQH